MGASPPPSQREVSGEHAAQHAGDNPGQPRLANHCIAGEVVRADPSNCQLITRLPTAVGRRAIDAVIGCSIWAEWWRHASRRDRSWAISRAQAECQVSSARGGATLIESYCSPSAFNTPASVSPSANICVSRRKYSSTLPAGVIKNSSVESPAAILRNP